MRRILALLITAALAATACASDSAIETSSVAAPAEPPATDAPATPAVDAAPTAPVEVAVPSGREALAGAQGSPHVLWFWGAN